MSPLTPNATDFDSNFSQLDHDRVYQADALKGLAILSVLILHSAGTEMLRAAYAWLHIWQAVPVLCVLLSFTGMMTRINPIGSYFSRRVWRLGVPFAVIWLLSLAVDLARGTTSFIPLLAVGVLPAASPGNYFVTLLFQFVLLLPLLRRLFAHSPWLGVSVSFAVNLAFELVASAIEFDGYLYSSCALRYLFAIALGMWLATGRSALPLVLPSLAYLVGYASGFDIPIFLDLWEPQNLVGAGYAAMLVQLGLKYLSRRRTALVALGQASYHIFLVQVLWFGQLAKDLPLSGWSLLVASLAICCFGGYVFYRLECALVAGIKKPLRSSPDSLGPR